MWKLIEIPFFFFKLKKHVCDSFSYAQFIKCRDIANAHKKRDIESDNEAKKRARKK